MQEKEYIILVYTWCKLCGNHHTSFEIPVWLNLLYILDYITNTTWMKCLKIINASQAVIHQKADLKW